MGRPACLHPDVCLSVEHLLLAAHPAFSLFVKMSNVIIFFLLKKDELRNKTVACIFCAPLRTSWSLLSAWSTLQVANSLWGYNSMHTAVQFLCTFIPQALAKHNFDVMITHTRCLTMVFRLLFHFRDDYGEWCWADLAEEVPSSGKGMKIS